MNPSAPSGLVRLNNVVFYAHHGVLAEEHRVGGRYEVDVEMALDFTAAAQTDDLAQTVDYEAVYQSIHHLVTAHKFYLIERLAYLITEAILQEQHRVEMVKVVVRKVNPPVGGTCDDAEAVYTAHRKNLPA